MKQSFDVVIIGAGMAGMTAAIYLKRANLKMLLLEKTFPGGQMNTTATIENFPGHNKIGGPELSTNLFKQISDLEIDIKYENVIDITNDSELKTIKTETNQYYAKYVILASGRSPKRLGIEKEASLIGKGISLCAICDGFFYRNKTVAVVGAGNSALEEALYLSELASKVYLLNRKDSFSADKLVVDKLKNTENIEILYNTEIKEFNEENNRLSSLKLNNGNTLKIDGLFIYIGFKPELAFLDNLNLEKEGSYLKVNDNFETSVKGIYAVGDVINKEYYQLTTAASDATIAALNIKKDIG